MVERLSAGIFCMLVSLVSMTADLSHASDYKKLSKRALVVHSQEEGTVFLRPHVGNQIVEDLSQANNQVLTTTSCRLENKRIVQAEDLDMVLQDLVVKGYDLKDREVKNLPQGARAGTFTFYGTSLKFRESKHLPKSSIKLRIRAYIINNKGIIVRSGGTQRSAFLEIKIKNPHPEYPLSVHKYRLMMPDEDLLKLTKADPHHKKSFFKVIEELKEQAHARDKEHKDTRLIDVMFDKIGILASAESGFIKPIMAITYYRVSKKYDEKVLAQPKKRVAHKHTKNCPVEDLRSYEITIDESVQAFNVAFLEDENDLGIEKYFSHKEYALAFFPPEIHIVEFKQPDSIGYDGPGCFRRPDKMEGAQRDLWQAFVGTLGEKACRYTTPDRGKFAHVKQFIRIRDHKASDSDKTILGGPKTD